MEGRGAGNLRRKVHTKDLSCHLLKWKQKRPGVFGKSLAKGRRNSERNCDVFKNLFMSSSCTLFSYVLFGCYSLFSFCRVKKTVKFLKKHATFSNVVGMSIETLFDMWRNDEFWIFTKPIFWSTKLRQPRQCRDSCTCYIIFQNFVTYQITFLLTCQPH